MSSRSRYCMSETSPPKPRTVRSEKTRRRLTLGKRAREPYDAGRKFQWTNRGGR